MASAEKGGVVEKKAAEYSRGESPEENIAANRQQIRYAETGRGTYILARAMKSISAKN